MNGQLNTNRFFISFVILTIIACCANFISFVSPYWIQSLPSAHSSFKCIGLWTACFDGYMRPNDYSEAYFGCYYIYSVEYDRIREWINPIWFYSIQVISSCGILIHSLVTFGVLCQTTNSIDRESLIVAKINLIGHFLTSVAISATLVAFAVARYDGTWMPNPNLNTLSWSYGIAAISLLFTLISFIIGFMRYLYLDALEYGKKAALLNNDYDEEGESGSPRPPKASQLSQMFQDYPAVVDNTKLNSEELADEDVENVISRSDYHDASRYDPQHTSMLSHSSRGFA